MRKLFAIAAIAFAIAAAPASADESWGPKPVDCSKGCIVGIELELNPIADHGFGGEFRPIGKTRTEYRIARKGENLLALRNFAGNPQFKDGTSFAEFVANFNHHIRMVKTHSVTKTKEVYVKQVAELQDTIRKLCDRLGGDAPANTCGDKPSS